jgi:hypothetical protein
MAIHFPDSLLASVTLYGLLLGGQARFGREADERPKTRLPRWPCHNRRAVERRRALKTAIPSVTARRQR